MCGLLNDNLNVIREALTNALTDLTQPFDSYTPEQKEQKRAEYIAALLTLEEAAGWEMLPDGEYMLTNGNDKYDIGVSGGGADVSWEKNGYYHRAQEMEFPDELRLFRKRQPARSEGDA